MKDELEDKRLDAFIGEWYSSMKDVSKDWVLIATYVRDNNISRQLLISSLVEVCGMSTATAKNEATRLLRVANPENEDLIKQLQEGQITVREAREIVKYKKKK